jgi:hypothetical protein
VNAFLDHAKGSGDPPVAKPSTRVVPREALSFPMNSWLTFDSTGQPRHTAASQTHRSSGFDLMSYADATPSYPGLMELYFTLLRWTMAS